MDHSRTQIGGYAFLPLIVSALVASFPLFNSSALTLSLPHNVTEGDYPVSDPFVWHHPGYTDAIKFYNYQTWLPHDKVIRVLHSANVEAYRHGGEIPILEPLLFLIEDVQLVLTPKEGMNWWAWATASWGMRMTVEDYGMYFEWKFTIFTRRLGEVGYGTLSSRASDSVDTSKR